jgi:hypothetical protein
MGQPASVEELRRFPVERAMEAEDVEISGLRQGDEARVVERLVDNSATHRAGRS